jgi:hypothetical protein
LYTHTYRERGRREEGRRERKREESKITVSLME